MQFPMHDLRTRGETGRLKCTVILSFVVTGLAFTLLGYAIGRSHNLQSGRKCDTCRETGVAWRHLSPLESVFTVAQYTSVNRAKQEAGGVACQPQGGGERGLRGRT
ncbi:hypothetical protein E2C01_070547 [Portunus trituberculatus]|uniref:Uncharacterized protein n=1 Tax=Portunus trituberculatus TaxID=210409 RepID=A0A5B7HXK8_PORTR|nr:hypothetical protein [Portunus trituberculatus]